MDEYFITDNEDGLGKILIIKSNWSEHYKHILKNNRIEILRLSSSAGWSDKDLKFISALTGLKGVEIYSWNIEDLSPLYDLHDIIQLGIQVNLRREFNLSNFPNLKTLLVYMNKKMQQLPDCMNLEYLNAINFPYDSFISINRLTKLRKILLTSRKLVTTEGISNLENIIELDLFDCRYLNTIIELDRLKKLNCIDITCCRKITSLEGFVNIPSLECLHIEDCGEIETISVLKNCRKLKRLFVIGDTDIKDGDLSILEELPNLEEVNFTRRRHYNLSIGEISEIINAKKTQQK